MNHSVYSSAALEWYKAITGTSLLPVIGLIALVVFWKQIRYLLTSIDPTQITSLTVLGLRIDRLIDQNNAVASKVDEANARIAELFALSMSNDTFMHLYKFNKGRYGSYYLDPDLQIALGAELRYLRLLGYIAFDSVPGINGVGFLPTGNRESDDLSNYVRITDAGRYFVKLREQYKDTNLSLFLAMEEPLQK